MYVLVRRDLSKSQQAVQACHAVAELMQQPDQLHGWDNGTMVLLEVDDIHYWINELSKIDAHLWEEFYEPDVDKTTSLAVVCNNGDIRKIFSKLKLI